MEYIKLLAIQVEGDISTEIVEEVHRNNIDDTADYIKEHPHRNTTWIIKQMTY